MGFDNECIVNIQSLAGEYFCPVCRLLVNPNEALQSQCTHLYCKPCLSYIANGTRACPYDGYLVTEVDSKLLIESNKPLAETIGKIPVHCLYHRSGCTWQGPLSECLNHCAGCAFGNSPVVCNRCGIQIVHRQVQEHAQNCPGVQPQSQAVEGSQLASIASSTDQGLTLKIAGTSSSQAPISQTVTAGPVSNQQITTSAQVPAAGQMTVPTSEQWYQQQQQQYQQYYQQFVGYDPYQQHYQQYYPYQAQQPQVYAQPLVQSQSQGQPQSQAQPQLQPSVQGQPPVLSQLPMQPQPHAPALVVSQPPNAQQPQSTMLPTSQPPSQVQSSQPAPYPLLQLASRTVQYPNQPFVQAQAQVPQYQPSQAQMPQPAVQPPTNSPLQRQPNTLPQMHSQIQPAPAIPHPSLQANQQVIAQTQAQYPLVLAVTGYHSYPQPQPPLAQSGAPQQQPLLVQPNTQPNLAQNQGQLPLPSQVRPFQSHVAIPNQQQPSMLPSPPRLPGIPLVQQQPMYPQTQQQGHPVPQRAVMQQFPQNISQQLSLPQQPPFGGQSVLVQNPQTSVHQQLPMQSQLRPPAPQSFPAQMPRAAYPQLQRNAVTSLSLRAPHQSPNLLGRPALPSEGPPQMYPHMAGPANPQGMLPGFNQKNMIASRGEVHPPLELQPAVTLHSKSENTVSGQRLDLLPNATIGRDASSSLGADTSVSKITSEGHIKAVNDGHQGVGEVGESKQSDATAHQNQEPVSANDSEEIAKRTAAHESRDSIRLGGRLGEVGDQKDVPVILTKLENKSMEEDKKIFYGPSQLQEAEKMGVRMGSSLKESDNETKGVYQPGQEEKKLAQAQALVSSFGHGTDAQRGEGVKHPSQPDIAIDHGRNRNLMLHNGPSSMPLTMQPHPAGPSHQSHVSGHPMAHHGTPGFDNPLPGQAQQSALKLPLGDLSGGMRPPGSISHSAPFGMVGRHLLPGPDGIRGHKYPNTALEAEKFSNPRLGYMDGGAPDASFLGNMETGGFGRPFDIHSNRSRMTGPPGVDPLAESFLGDRSDRSYIGPSQRGYNRTIHQEDRRKFRGPHHDAGGVGKFGQFQSGSSFGRGPADKAFDGHPDGPAFAAASSRNFYPYGGATDSGDRPFGYPGDNIERLSSFRLHVQNFGPVPGQNRRHMDGLPPRSPAREFSGVPRHAFGDLPGLPPKNLGSELDRREPYLFNDSVSGSFPESRFQGLQTPFPKEFGENRNLRMGELVRNGDQISHNLMNSDLHRGQISSRRLRLGESVDLSFSRGLAGEPSGPESFGVGRPNHPRFPEPGFRSSFSLQGFPNDGKYPGDPKSFDNSRKRQAGSMGWCRICKVDCETVEGLEMHSQTREHQKAAIDIVRSIKQQNAKRQKISSTNSVPVEDAGKVRSTSADGRGNKL